jgi:hypothetical protein
MFMQYGIVYDIMVKNKTYVNGISTEEAEYIVANAASYEAERLQKFLTGLFDLELDPTLTYCDNQSCVNILENLFLHDNSNHIEMKYHYIQDMV